MAAAGLLRGKAWVILGCLAGAAQHAVASLYSSGVDVAVGPHAVGGPEGTPAAASLQELGPPRRGRGAAKPHPTRTLARDPAPRPRRSANDGGLGHFLRQRRWEVRQGFRRPTTQAILTVEEKRALARALQRASGASREDAAPQQWCGECEICLEPVLEPVRPLVAVYSGLFVALYDWQCWLQYAETAETPIPRRDPSARPVDKVVTLATPQEVQCETRFGETFYEGASVSLHELDDLDTDCATSRWPSRTRLRHLTVMSNTFSVTLSQLLKTPGQLFKTCAAFPNLRALDWGGSMFQLDELPHDFGEFRSLQELRLVRHNLADLPANFAAHFPMLEQLDLDRNKLQQWPENFGTLPSLKRLTLTGNHLTDLPANLVAQLPNLEVLELDRQVRLPANFMAQFPNLAKVIRRSS